MPATTLARVLKEAESLPQEEQSMLAEILRGRQIETWRRETAEEAKKAIRALKSGKGKARSVEDVITRLRAGKDCE